MQNINLVREAPETESKGPAEPTEQRRQASIPRDSFRRLVALGKAIALAGPMPQHPNARFAAVLCHGLRSDYLALIEKRYIPSFKEVKVARGMAEQLLAVRPDYYDAWIAVGVENYMLSMKPAPVRWLLKVGGGQNRSHAGNRETEAYRRKRPLPVTVRAPTVSLRTSYSFLAAVLPMIRDRRRDGPQNLGIQRLPGAHLSP
jgi:hypothetical protein